MMPLTWNMREDKRQWVSKNERRGRAHAPARALVIYTISNLFMIVNHKDSRFGPRCSFYWLNSSYTHLPHTLVYIYDTLRWHDILTHIHKLSEWHCCFSCLIMASLYDLINVQIRNLYHLPKMYDNYCSGHRKWILFTISAHSASDVRSIVWISLFFSTKLTN